MLFFGLAVLVFFFAGGAAARVLLRVAFSSAAIANFCTLVPCVTASILSFVNRVFGILVENGLYWAAALVCTTEDNMLTTWLTFIR